MACGTDKWLWLALLSKRPLWKFHLMILPHPQHLQKRDITQWLLWGGGETVSRSLAQKVFMGERDRNLFMQTCLLQQEWQMCVQSACPAQIIKVGVYFDGLPCFWHRQATPRA
jgi:hypothetical protein